MAVTLRVRVDPHGTTAFNLLVATLLLVSRMWWDRKGHRRVADAFGTVAVAGLGGMVCGAVAMLELRLHFPIVDGALREFDLALGVDGLAIIDWQLRQGDWLFALMRPAYNFTLQMFFVSMVVLALLGDRVEAWRGAFCFVGTLLTTCLIAIFMPAKGLAVWATPELFSRLPERAMRSFWPRFDDFYFGFDPGASGPGHRRSDLLPLVPRYRRLPNLRNVAEEDLDPHTRQRVSRDPAPLDPARRGTLYRRPPWRLRRLGRVVHLLPIHRRSNRWASGIREDLRQERRSPERSKRARACPTYPHSMLHCGFCGAAMACQGSKAPPHLFVAAPNSEV